MTFANKGKRKQKTRGAILQTAVEHTEGCTGYFAGQHIYNVFVNVWKTAFTRGYDKAMREQSKPLKDAIKYVQETDHRKASDALVTLLQDVNGVSDADAAADFEVVGNQVRRERAAT